MHNATTAESEPAPSLRQRRLLSSTAFDEFDDAAIEPLSKRRRGYPSETHVKCGSRSVSTPMGDKEFLEKLGRNDPCPCGSGLRFKRCCLRSGLF